MMREEVGDVGSSGKGFRLSSQGIGKVWMGFKEGMQDPIYVFANSLWLLCGKWIRGSRGGGREII